MKFYRFELQNYMDESPKTKTYVFDSKEDALAFEKHMNTVYSGGKIKLLEEMSEDDAIKHCISVFKQEAMSPSDDTPAFLEKLSNAFKECYGHDIHEYVNQ